MANRNNGVGEILKLAYELERSVLRPGPDAADWFAQAIYEPTKLDSHLLPHILADRFDLVLLTGNPGDGKSAFLSKVPGDAVTESGRSIRVLHDATEPSDSGDRAASALADLESFLEPLTDSGWDLQQFDETMYIVGINKGLLVRAFLAPDCRFSRLTESIQGCLQDEGIALDPIKIAVVDLNRRSLAGLSLDDPDTLFDRILSRLVATGLWEAGGCDDCTDAEWCPFYNNALTLRKARPAQRLRLLWLVHELRSGRHNTIRDLLAALAYLLVGHEDMFREGDQTSGRPIHPCAFVERERASGSYLALFRRCIYNSTFVDDDIYEEHARLLEGQSVTAHTFGMAPWVVTDELNSLDPAVCLSNDYWDEVEEKTLRNPHQAARRIIDDAIRGNYSLEEAVFSGFCDALAKVGSDLDDVEPSQIRYGELLNVYQWLTYLLLKTIKRRSFFLATVPGISSLTSFASLDLFVGALKYLGDDEETQIDAFECLRYEVVPRGLIRSEGIAPQEDNPRDLKVRWSASRGEVGAVITIPQRAAEWTVNPKEQPYVETCPRILSFALGEELPAVRPLELTLDTCEGLYRLANGYHEGYSGVPRSYQLRNFREALRGVESNDLLLVDFADLANTVSVQVNDRVRFD